MPIKNRIGAHVSAAGGLHKAIDRAHDIGANAVQIFSGSPRVWKRKPLEDFDTVKLFAKQTQYDVTPIFTHSLYLVNLASDKKDLLQKSIDVLKHDMQFDALIHGAGIVVHVGSHTGRGWDKVKKQVAKTIREIVEASPQQATFLIENSAGQKGKLHSDLADIKWTLDQMKDLVEEGRVGWCFDTCHAFANGYALGKSNSQKTNVQTTKPAGKAGITDYGTAQDAINRLELWSPLKCIHVNDSRDPFASGRDRHENIGKGEIPKEDLQYFLTLSELAEIPLITEVPGFDGKGPDKKNLNVIKKLVEIE